MPNERTKHRILRSEWFKLLPLLGLAFYTAFIPHLGYPYPIHMDEWFHLAFFRAIQATSSLEFVDPFLGANISSPSLNLEAGYQLFWSVFQQISGIPCLTVFRYFPGIVLIITTLSAYAMTRREGFGWEAAFFVCLIPTTIGILGPAFMVPVAMGLIFIPLSVFTVFNNKGIRAYIVLFIFTAFLLSIHAPSAIVLGLILGPYILLNLRHNAWHSLGIALALLVPFLAPFPWIFGLLQSTFQSLFEKQALPTYVSFPQFVETYGYIPVLLSLLGTFWLAIRGGRKGYGLVLGLLALLAMLATFFTFGYGVHIVYERGLMFAMLMIGVVAGAGLTALKNISLLGELRQRLKVPVLTNNLGLIMCLIIIVVTLAIAIPDRQKTPYYHIIDNQEYADFVWIEQNVGKEHTKAILDPWKATAFTALTGKQVYTRLHAYPQPSDEEARRFLNEGCTNTEFLRKNGISIVYSRGDCKNPDLIEVRKSVYLLAD